MSKYYYSDGTVSDLLLYTKKLHREDGPAIEWDNGDWAWFYNNYPHRDDGPAVRESGALQWFYHGKRHRLDGPAFQPLGMGLPRWYINGGEQLSEKDFEAHPERQKYLFQQALEKVLA